ncbi:glycosyltransferase [Neobacillus thermocopriae]|uniref:glycosyltransferase n=1 Tax=Neobacillus thermocopriae TaxID=1215031 RepID=UPI002E21DC59|nr:glycosyltransferase [Neobacillus thermocopriae]MED3712627.1 glycosyltransferase [Neobacillus thermocopriae]
MNIQQLLKKGMKAINENGLGNTLQKIQRRAITRIGINKWLRSDNPQLKAIYNKILNQYKNKEINGLVVLTSGLEFEELYNQRTINLAKYLSDHGLGVLFVTWQWDDQEQLKKSYQTVYKNIYQVPVYDFTYELDKLKILDEIVNKIYITTFPAKLFYKSIEQLKHSGYRIIYDIMDEWEEFYKTGDASWYERKIEEQFVQVSDLVTVVSKPLKDKFSFIREDIYVIGNGYTAALSGRGNIALKEKAEDQRIHIGYFGHLTPSWFDWDLILSLAENDSFYFHFIGHGAPEEILQKIEAQPNCKFYGKVHPSELYKFVEKWHIGIIPFKHSKLSEAVDPIKIYEYLYFGLPTVSTGIPHIGNYPLVTHCNNQLEVKAAIDNYYEQLMNGKLDLADLNDFLGKTTWEARFNEMMSLLNK